MHFALVVESTTNAKCTAILHFALVMKFTTNAKCNLSDCGAFCFDSEMHYKCKMHGNCIVKSTTIAQCNFSRLHYALSVDFESQQQLQILARNCMNIHKIVACTMFYPKVHQHVLCVLIASFAAVFYVLCVSQIRPSSPVIGTLDHQ